MGRILRVGIKVRPFSNNLRSSREGEKFERLMVENCSKRTAFPVWGGSPLRIKNDFPNYHKSYPLYRDRSEF